MRRERGAARCHAIQRSKTHTRCTQTAHHYRCKKPTPLARARHGVTRERAPPSSPKEHWLLEAGSKAAEKPLETETVAPLRRHFVLADEDAPLRPAWSGGAVGSKISLAGRAFSIAEPGRAPPRPAWSGRAQYRAGVTLNWRTP